MYRSRVPAHDPRAYLWTNVCALMGQAAPSINTVQARTKIGRGTVQRIRDRDTGTRLDSLIAIADAFGVEVWQLVHPTLGRGLGGNLSEGAVEVAGLFERLSPEGREHLRRLLQAMQPIAAPPV